MATTVENKSSTKDLVDLCRVYLVENFHKFSEVNRIRISLALIQKSMPTQIEGEVQHNHFYKEIIEKPSLNRLPNYAPNYS